MADIGFPYRKATRPRSAFTNTAVDVEQLARVVRLRDGRVAQWWCATEGETGGALYAVSDGSWLPAHVVGMLAGPAGVL